MRINHNIASLNTYRQLTMNNGSSAKNIERLSSGLRINRAGDDAAGLAISEKMRGQIRGLEMATRNAQDGISMIQTAEGALNETHSILQRMRELAVQGSNDTQTDKDRAELQKEISQLKDEIDRISSTTEFNTKKLLNGDLQAAKTAQGDVLESAKSTIRDLTSITTSPTENAYYITGSGSFTVSGLASGNIAVTITSGVYSGAGLAAAIETALNASQGYSDLNVSFANGTFTFTHAAGNGSGNISITTSGSLASTLGITSAVTINSGAAPATSTGAAFDAFDMFSGNNEFTITSSSGANFSVVIPSGTDLNNVAQLATAINGALSGTSASGLISVAASGSDLVWSIASGATAAYAISSTASDTGIDLIGATSGDTLSNFEVLTALEDQDGDSFGIKAGDVITINGKVNGTAKAETSITVGAFTTVKDLTNQIASTLGLDSGDVSFTNGKVVINGEDGEDSDIQDVKLAISGNTKFNNTFSNFAETQDAQDDGTNNALSFQIGANQDQTMRVDIAEMSTGSLSLSSVDISTEQGAQNSITVINNALEKVSAERAKLGAFQNRLEHTINNLGTSAENLTASESRIRDVDMAKEMMEFTKNNILTQAAQSMLAQANQQPQGVLQLLR